MTDDVQAPPASASEPRHRAADDVGIVQPRDFTSPGTFTFKSGQSIQGFTLRYETYGALNATRDNAVLVCHALSGDHHCAGWHSETDAKPGWWNNLIGERTTVPTTARFFVVAAPTSSAGARARRAPAPSIRRPAQPCSTSIPVHAAVRDMVNSQKLVLDHLGVAGAYHAAIGGSMGGMTAMKFAMEYPHFTRRQVVMASTANESAQAIAFNEVGRQAIIRDHRGWNNGDYPREAAPRSASRSPLMATSLPLRRRDAGRKFGGKPLIRRRRRRMHLRRPVRGEAYLRHQGQSFINRFDANSLHLYIARTIDQQFDHARAAGSLGRRSPPCRPSRWLWASRATGCSRPSETARSRSRLPSRRQAGQLRGARPAWARLLPPGERGALRPPSRIPRAQRRLRLRLRDLRS